jgi:hypothetical protein
MKNTNELQWIKVADHSTPFAVTSMEEYVDSTGRFCKQVWNDGYEEIFEISE